IGDSTSVVQEGRWGAVRPNLGGTAMFTTARNVLVCASLVGCGLSGCVMVPVAADGTPIYPSNAGIYPAYPIIPVPTVQGPGPNYLAPVPGRSTRPAPPSPTYTPASIELPPAAGPAAPAALQARLYPANEIATETGLLSGTVTNMMTGKGIFQLNYRGEVLTGEATRVPGDDRRGVANAYGQRGTYMSCDYRMTTPYQGTGTCSLSTGAQYQVHIGG
ncbi:MAG TPA: hypothetical protein VFP91_04460, partial [Vicinamibacterales bacterium]|nr:hypothetical protein [Vicinamibacterales bacterium]